MKRDTVVIGGSAGSLPVIREILRDLAPDAAVSVFVVMHVSPAFPSSLPEILARETALHVHHPYHGEPVEPGHVYIAPPDRHLVVTDGRIGLTIEPREHHARPAVDVLFRSAAADRGSRVIGVILSGSLNDGATGLAEVKRHGGLTIVQDPVDATVTGMPTAAIERGEIDYVLAAAAIGPKINELVSADLPAQVLAVEVSTATPREVGDESCPGCWDILHGHDHDSSPPFERPVAHRFGESALLAAEPEGVESALWMAVRSLEEQADMSRRMANRAVEAGRSLSAERFCQDAHDADLRAVLVRRLLEPA